MLKTFKQYEGHEGGVPRAVLQVGRKNQVVAGGPTTIESPQNVWVLDLEPLSTPGSI